MRIHEERVAAEAAHEQKPPSVDSRALAHPSLRQQPLLGELFGCGRHIVLLPRLAAVVRVHEPRGRARREERAHRDIRTTRFAAENARTHRPPRAIAVTTERVERGDRLAGLGGKRTGVDLDATSRRKFGRRLPRNITANDEGVDGIAETLPRKVGALGTDLELVGQTAKASVAQGFLRKSVLLAGEMNRRTTTRRQRSRCRPCWVHRVGQHNHRRWHVALEQCVGDVGRAISDRVGGRL